jgi:hypothetical protein
VALRALVGASWRLPNDRWLEISYMQIRIANQMNRSMRGINHFEQESLA